jgi:mannan polymerase II complex MNN10 subunit
VTWESAKAKTEGVNGYPSFSTQNNGFFNRHYRNISNSLPSFNMGPEKSYAEKEKLGRGRWMARDGGRIARLRSMARRVSRKAKIRFLLVIAFIVMVILFYTTRKITTNRTLSPILTFGSFTLLLA